MTDEPALEPNPDQHRVPYVGAGADGARRSAQIDREEADALEEPSGRADLLDSAERWDRQAQALDEEAPDGR